MIYLRSSIYFVGQILSAVVVFSLATIFFFSYRKRLAVISYWAKFNIWTLKVICKLDYRITGLQSVIDQPAVILCNHQSAWETLMLQKLFNQPAFVLKKSLLWIPFFGWGLALFDPIAIDRGKKLKSLDLLIKKGIKRLDSGRPVVVFPEGTRQPVGRLGEFQVGGAMMSKKSGRAVVPVAHNAGVFWPKSSFLKYPGTIDIHIGTAISPLDKKTRQVNEEARQWIGDTVANLPIQKG